ncbi:DUF4876 domain-containing protein [Tenacibaculum maritimum]|uniref:DUF4876 domain-containing protein n=1 Tax=Tenacibaculum maritimum TaxID=107401 RepID=UPI003876F460
MKKKIFFYIFLIWLQSCHKEQLPIPYGNIQIQIGFETAYKNFPKNNIEVQLLSEDETVLATEVTNKEGSVIFSNIVNDMYRIKIIHTFTEDVVFSFLGLSQKIDFIGETNLRFIRGNKTTQENIVLKTNRVGGFVIKEVYHSNAGAGIGADSFYQYVRFNDSFFEIYNNSPEILYADGLQIGIATNFYEDKWKADRNHVYVEQIFKIKGNGQQYPVAPGKSIVIAATAVNHISAAGLTQNQIQDLYLFGTVPKSVDLSGADFESYFGGFATNYDIDVANIPNLVVEFNTYPSITEIVTTNRGIGLVIFKDLNIETLETVKVDKGAGLVHTFQYKKIPISILIDAFEAQHTMCFPSSSVGVHLSVLEAWEGKSYRRKTNTIINQRRVLLDTNNCIADFEELSHATPGKF